MPSVDTAAPFGSARRTTKNAVRIQIDARLVNSTGPISRRRGAVASRQPRAIELAIPIRTSTASNSRTGCTTAVMKAGSESSTRNALGGQSASQVAQGVCFG